MPKHDDIFRVKADNEVIAVAPKCQTSRFEPSTSEANRISSALLKLLDLLSAIELIGQRQRAHD
jgi:hypothetical protein